MKRMVINRYYDRYEYADYVREYLTDYNDNFIGEPCQEIIEEVLVCIDMRRYLTHEGVINEIHSICERMFG